MADVKEELKACLEVMSSELKCPICLSVVRDAISLPCNHFYCTACLDGVSAHSGDATFPCPKCRTQCQRRKRVKDPTIQNLAALYRRLHAVTSEDLDLDMLSQGLRIQVR